MNAGSPQKQASKPLSRWSATFPRSCTSATFARRVLTDLGSRWLDRSQLMDFAIAAGEALANCVEHGGGREMHIESWCDGVTFVVEIGDCGTGFKPHLVRPTADNVRGFGIFLMHELVDEVEFFDKGRTVRLVKQVRETHKSSGDRSPSPLPA